MALRTCRPIPDVASDMARTAKLRAGGPFRPSPATPAPAGAEMSPSGRRTARPKLRVETLISIRVHRPTSEPGFRLCRLPALQRQLTAATGAHPRPINCDLAAMDAELARRVAPAIPVPITAALVP